MKPIAIAGLLFVALGLAALVYQGVTYTKHDRVLDVGTLHATVDRQTTLSLPPALGIAAMAGGAALLVVGLRRRA